jgi:hypothetical protein
VAIPRAALPFVFLTDVLPGDSGALRFRYRLIGTGVVEMTGRDLTGKEITSEHYGQHVDLVLVPFRRVATSGRAMRSIGRTAWRDVAFLAEAVYLPLGVDDRVEMVLGITVMLEPGEAIEPDGFQALSSDFIELELVDG